MRTIFRFLSIAAAGVLAACSSASTAAAPSAPPANAASPPPGIYCIWKPSLRTGYFTVIDTQHFILEGNGKAYYLVTLLAKCFELDTRIALAFDARSDQICSAGDSIIVGGERCGITGIEPVASPDAAKALVAARKAPRSTPVPAATP